LHWCGGKGGSDSNDVEACGANIVAICDVDRTTLDRKARGLGDKFPDLKKYNDYRKLLDEMGKNIDAVTVSTPDHNHGVAAIRAMKMGKHCFCQKPLVQTVHEARLMRQLAKEKNLATQMGNQGSAAPGLRRAVEVIQAGVNWQSIGTARVVQSPALAAGSSAARRRGRSSGKLELGCLAWAGPKAAVQNGCLSQVQLARLVRFWDRRAG
jgi:predicted dehydrogenase